MILNGMLRLLPGKCAQSRRDSQSSQRAQPPEARIKERRALYNHGIPMGALSQGSQLGAYEILNFIGAGGMGEVYRARDTRLGRDVAIKILAETFAHDADKLARFEREARVLASLNHPNIAAIYGFEQAGDTKFLVMEYVSGKTLRGPMPVEEALPIANQIAEGLEAAHEKCIIHRDLKPTNIKITPEGKAKVLDFGLAKAMLPEGTTSSPGPDSPTISVASTREGFILGTAAYMSPEQARGKPVDKRADIWAFGCVLYEMLTGKPVFAGDTVTDTLAAVVRNEPDLAAVPEVVRGVLRRCLQKDPARRLRDIADARLELEEAPEKTTTERPRRQWLPWAVAAATATCALIAALLWPRTPQAAPGQVVRSTMLLQGRSNPRAVAVSRDGSHVAYLSAPPGPIFLRRMDQFESKPVPGTENASAVFFSPDGQWLGFADSNKLKKVPVNGGAPMTVYDTGSASQSGGVANSGASWGANGDIIFGGGSDGLMRISADGGNPEVLTTLDEKNGERAHRWPRFLPDGRSVLFTIASSGAAAAYDDSKIAVFDLSTQRRHILIEGGSCAHYLSTGHLIYWRDAALFAVPFNAKQLRVTGPAVPVLQRVSGMSGVGFGDFDVSESGTLAYIPGGDLTSSLLLWVDRQGKAEPLPAAPRPYLSLQISPDGRRVALAIGPLRSRSDIWIYDLSREALTRVTSQPGAFDPVWAPDGKRIAFRFRPTPRNNNLAWVYADSSSEVELLLTLKAQSILPGLSWTPDGRTLVFTETSPAGVADLWVLSIGGERKSRPFYETPFTKATPAISPDGRWLAYVSDEDGRPQIYVRGAPRADGLPAAPGKWLISTDGGDAPRWSRNGRELFYRDRGKLIAVAIEPGPQFQAGTPKVLFEGNYHTHAYDVSPDGRRFLMVKPEGSVHQDPGAQQMHIIVDWVEELKRLASSG
jgi:serine/threonine-protein kinase